MTNRILILLLIVLYLASASLFAQDGHEGCDHSSNTVNESTPVVVEAGDHDHDSDAPCDGDDHDEIVVNLSLEAQKMAGLTFARVAPGYIVKTSELPGEVGFNEDRLVHIAPRFAGIALEARCRVGSYVNAGDIVAVVESNESMNSYSIEAPISGWIIERHITPGEYVSGESSIFALADLSTVWVNLAVYPKDAGMVKSGQEVLITAIGSKQQVTGTIDFVTPVLDILTRSSTARVVLPNPDNVWQPGTFVHAQVVTEAGERGLVVEKEAVQLIGEESVIFVVESPDEFVAVEVVVGDSDEHHVRIIEGITEGTEYVAAGAFELKAQIVTSSLSGHAGHGH
ncbi:MAG: efflux RND transporter periplasmic adaptor subunit [candidate division Zixibacteria bacterium]|nr:efflux RND transporter periplasmic adaptor subunit [candidate division Zixibacteria bacterium]